MSPLDNKGFTLTELLVVIAIVGIFTTIVMVNFQRGRESDEFKRATTELQQNFRLAQSYSIGGNSIKYCEQNSDAHASYPCEDDSYCNADAAPWDYFCKTAVPLGGYGIHVDSTELYTLFGDTTADSYFVDSIEDYVVVEKYIFTKGVHVDSFRFGTEEPIIPSSENILDLTFTPPTGKMNFYLNQTEALDGSSEPYYTIELLLSSDFVEDTCREISINKISGKISEAISSCNW